MLVLEVIQGADRGLKFELPAHEPQLIGRSTEALPITDTTVSRRHAELTPDDGVWYLADLDSANGTYVNGSRIKDRVQLSPGDQIRCGSTLFVFTNATTEHRAAPIEMFDSGAFDLMVHAKTDANEDSMVIASPDPDAAASGHLRVIYELTALTATTIERDEMLKRVMDLIFQRFEPDRGFILLLDDADARPSDAVVRYKTKPKTQDEGRIPVSRTIIRHTLTRREGLLSTNAMNDTRFQSGDSVREYGIRSAMCVPIIAGKRIFGVIHIDSSVANFTFSDHQLQLLTAIAQHTGLVLLSEEVIASRMQTERLAAMGQTVASLSHAIKNILQGLRGGADAIELALNRGDVDLAKEGWPILARNLDRIFALTMNMLTYSRQSKPDIELSSTNALVREIAELIQPQCDRRGIGLILDLDEDLPPIPFDINAMHQALMNLLANAQEAAPRKTGVITISTKFDKAAQSAVIVVADNGPGIPDHQKPRLFEAFQSTKGQRGTGLGLAVTKKIVTEHGGRIELAPHDGDGAAFQITLPSDRGRIDAGETKLPRPLSPEEREAQDF